MSRHVTLAFQGSRMGGNHRVSREAHHVEHSYILASGQGIVYEPMVPAGQYFRNFGLISPSSCDPPASNPEPPRIEGPRVA